MATRAGVAQWQSKSLPSSRREFDSPRPLFFSIDLRPPIPHTEIKALVEKYLGTTKRAGQGIARVRTHRYEDALARTRFGVPRAIFAPGVPDLMRDAESVLSNYFSMSFSAPHLFGDRVGAFAADVRELLESWSREGTFWDWPGDTELIIARKPG